MNHDELKQLISNYFDGQVSAEERAEAEEHLKSCSSCQAYYIQLHKLSGALKKWPTEELSADLENKIIKSLPQGLPGKEDKMNKVFHYSPLSSGIALTIATILILGTTQVYVKRGIEGRLKSATDDIGSQFSGGNTNVTKRSSMQARVRDTSQFMADKQKQQSTTLQYEPYYLSNNYAVDQVGSISQGVNRKILADKKGKEESRQMMAGAEMVYGGRAQAPATSYLMAKTIGEDESTQRLMTPESIPYGQDNEGFEYSRSIQYPTYYTYTAEEYKHIYENQFLNAQANPLSTFSIDVDTASYSNIRRYLTGNQLPPTDAVRIEEMVNYFTYDYPEPNWLERFSVTLKAAVCPWNASHKLVQIGIHGKELSQKEIPPSNLVFLIDVSGSMMSVDKLPLIKEGLRMMVNQLNDDERVAIVVYAGAAGLVLESTPGSQKQAILSAIDSLQAGGSTAGGAGIQLAYEVAKQNFIKNGNNRVILATDGDFNVGVSDDFALARLIEQKRSEGIFLTVLGVGTGNLKDNKMETLADKGNGNYHYLDSEDEARKVLVQELGSTLFTIAKDVKIQVEFNPQQVVAYKLIGYENRLLAKQDFNDDTKDAGELGAGHTVTALYEIVPAYNYPDTGVDPLVYQKNNSGGFFRNNDLMTVKLRYKEPQANTSKLIKKTIQVQDVISNPDGDFKFASAVAEFGLLLRNSPQKAHASYNNVLQRAIESQGKDVYGHRAEFIDLVRRAQQLDTRFPQPVYPQTVPYDDAPVEGSGIQFKGQ